MTLNGVPSRRSSPNVSPITESERNSRDQPHRVQIRKSSLPLPRAAQNSHTSTSAINGWRDKVGRRESPDGAPASTRWDVYSGEPTTSDSGKPAQVVPGTVQFHTDRNQEKPLGVSVEVSAGPLPKSFLADRLKKTGKKEWTQWSPPREEWKGASGRNTIIRPLMDKPLPPGKNPAFASAGRKQHTTPTPASRMTGRNSPMSTVAPKIAPKVPQQQQPIQPLKLSEDEDVIKPVVPLKIAKNSPRSPTFRDTGHHMNIGSGPDDTRSPLARNPSAEHEESSPNNAFTIMTPVQSPDEKESAAENQLRGPTEKLYISKEPMSRFSATTYNTTIPDSPPVTPKLGSDTQPPLPTPPDSVLNRKRPVPASGISMNKTTARKPTPSEANPTGKVLPQSPPEAEAVDRIASLEAKLDDLNRRRGNLQTVIHQLTHVVQPSSIAYDIASRQEIKKTVEGLNTESAAVAKEIHETGLTLHRAKKRRDEQSMFEPTGLWVRRVTT